MGGVSRAPGFLWGCVLPLMTVVSLSVAVPVVARVAHPDGGLPPPPPAPPPPVPPYATYHLYRPNSSPTFSPTFTIFINSTRPPTTTPDPSIFTPSQFPTSTRPRCREPEECCVHPFESEEFLKCCEERGCCPMQCPVTEPGGEMSSLRRCDAWGCCVHRPGSPRHEECCRRHGCCPLCHRFSSGCCFNGINYAFGSLVLDMPDVCLQLVCAAKLQPIYPFFVAVITPVKTCSFTDMSDACLGCPVHRCVDETGLVRGEGDTWAPSPCTECLCLSGRVTCRSLAIDCKPRPHPGCVAIPGPCCPTYHCEDGCFDDNSVFRPVGSQWPSADPCKVFVCTEAGVRTTAVRCDIPPRPHEGCHQQGVEGQCCPIWNCSQCLDTDGTYHPLNDVWEDGCLVKECTERGVVVRDRFCPTLGPPPHETCFPEMSEETCCEEWHCIGCWDNGVLHLPGEVWPSDHHCFNKFCGGKDVVLQRVDCPDFPKPHESCFEFLPEGACCRTWNCSGCLDGDGVFHPQFEEWQTDSCTIHVCHLDGITTKAVTCPPLGPIPHYSCHKEPTEDGCCQRWKCNGCSDDDGFLRPLGAEWPSKDNPCETFKCTESGITSILIACDPPPPPHEGCFLQSVDGQCCQTWNCSGCVDEDGMFHPLYHEWKSDPCTTHLCKEGGIQTAETLCLPPPRPHESCELISLPGVCCQVWNCKYNRIYKGCHEDNEYYEDGAEWTTDNPCVRRRCVSGTVATTQVNCSMVEQPTRNCFKEDQIGECCPKWNCSGCLDDDGVFRELHVEWRPSPCIINSCTESGIAVAFIDCPIELPGPGCHFVHDDECCPTLKCSGCVDKDGNPRHDGEEWPSDDLCLVFRCVDSEVKEEVILCNETSPLPICFPFKEEDRCCPTWNCSGCLDENGLFHLIGESWTAPFCLGQKCTAQGIIPDTIVCPEAPQPWCLPKPLLPDQCCEEWLCDNGTGCAAVLCEAPPPDQDCISYTPPGRCCPVFTCKPNCSTVLCAGPPLGQECTPYTPPGQCCPVYSCRETFTPNCSNVRCHGPPSGQDCESYTLQGHCCPFYQCRPITVPPPFKRNRD